MRIGVPKEIKDNEYRVGLTPAAVREYVACGHNVLVQSGAGSGIDAEDAQYEEVGAEIAPDADSVFAASDRPAELHRPEPDGL